MNKIFVFILVFLACPLIAGIYGMLHDQLTYTISPEYYTKFKFITFGTDPGTSPRLQACFVGFRAAWWTGIPVGLILAPLGLIHYDAKTQLRVSLQAVALALAAVVLTGLAGLAYGWFSLSQHTRDYFPDWFIPDNVSDLPAYIAVGAMHNFSYIGGTIGLFAGAAWQVWKKQQIKKSKKLPGN
jgi:hypothetical protein